MVEQGRDSLSMKRFFYLKKSLNKASCLVSHFGVWEEKAGRNADHLPQLEKSKCFLTSWFSQ